MTGRRDPVFVRTPAGVDILHAPSLAERIPLAELLVAAAAVLLRIGGLAIAASAAGGLEAAVFGWDGALYRQIATGGYPPGVPLEGAANWAFFPVWPALLALLIRLPFDPVLVVVAFGVVLTVVDVLLLLRLLGPRIGGSEAALLALAWAAAPPNWVYLAAYSEGIFVALQLLLLLALERGGRGRIVLVAFVVGLARPQGAFWALAAAIAILRDRGGWFPRFVAAGIAVSGAALWQGVVSWQTGILGGWFAIEKLPGWEMGFGILPFTTAIDAAVGLTQGRIDRGLAMIPVLLAVIAAIVGLARRRETIVGRWPTVVVATNALFVSGGIGGIPRFVGGAPLLFLAVTGWAVERRWRAFLLVALLAAASAGFALYNFASFGSNP